MLVSKPASPINTILMDGILFRLTVVILDAEDSGQQFALEQGERA